MGDTMTKTGLEKLLRRFDEIYSACDYLNALAALNEYEIHGPTTPELLSRKAQLLFDLKRFGEALTTIEEAKASYSYHAIPFRADDLLGEAVILRSMGRFTESLAAIDKAQKSVDEFAATLDFFRKETIDLQKAL
jgi:tetratricopeptide (TPR) repeat protein